MEKKKKVFGIVELYCGKSGKSGFYNSQEIGIAKALKKRGYSCVVFYPDLSEKKIKEEIIEDDIIVVRCPAKALGVHSFYDWSIFLKYSVQVVQIGSDNQLFAPNVARFCERNGIRFYNYIGTIYSDTANKYKRMLLKLILKRNIRLYKKSKCFVKTNDAYNQLKKMDIKDIEIMPVGLDVSVIPDVLGDKKELCSKLDIPKDKEIILYVGRIDPYKRPERLIDLMISLSDRFYFVIIGNGSQNSLFQEMLNCKQCKGRYKWIKQIPNNLIHEYYLCSDYFVNFNNKEIFGMSILEAMYHGCNVIAYHAPGPDTIIEDRKSGFLVSDQRTMLEIIDSGRKIEPEKIKQRVLSSFTWDKSIEKIIQWLG